MSAAIEYANRSQDSSQPDAAATAAIQAAIQQANYAENGVAFGPFRMKIVPSSYEAFWTTADQFIGRSPMTFFLFANRRDDGFLPLGDIALPGYGSEPFTVPPPPSAMMVFAPSELDPTSLVNPIGFRQVLDDHGSGNVNAVSYWWPIAPEGYSAVGLCFNPRPPSVGDYWCVKNKYLQSIVWSPFWTEHDGFDADGSLQVPAFPEGAVSPTSDGIVIVPQTFSSVQDAANEPAFALVAKQAELPFTPFEPPAPAYDPNIVSGDSTTYGLTHLKVVPYTAVAGDASYPNQPLSSPFYYVASEPYWLCTDSLPTPDGGIQSVSVTVGSSQSETDGFKETTTLAVSAEFGVEYGGVSAKVSATFTKEFELSTEKTATHDTSVTTNIQINFPKQPVTWIWARQTQLAVFRNDLTELTPISYGNHDQRFIPDGAQVVREKE